MYFLGPASLLGCPHGSGITKLSSKVSNEDEEQNGTRDSERDVPGVS